MGNTHVSGWAPGHRLHLPRGSAADSDQSSACCRSVMLCYNVNVVDTFNIFVFQEFTRQSNVEETSCNENPRILFFFSCTPSNVCIFCDLHWFLLSITGPNHVSLFKAEGEISELNSKLLLYYTPQVTPWNSGKLTCFTLYTKLYFTLSLFCKSTLLEWGPD